MCYVFESQQKIANNKNFQLILLPEQKVEVKKGWI